MYSLAIISLLIVASNRIDSSNTSYNDRTKDDNSSCFADTDEQGIDNKVSTLGPKEMSRILIEGSHAFSFDLIKELNKFESKETSQGLVISPSSIWSALIVLYMGTSGSTEKELKTRLKLQKLPKVSIGMAYQGLRLWNDLKKNMTKITDISSEKTTLSQANKIFFNNKLKLNKCLAEFFDTDIQEIEFSSNPQRSLNKINNWIKDQTRGKIRDLIPNGAINPWTKMIIANAIYFKSLWLNQFNKDNTKKDTFFVTPTEEISVDMMSIEANFMYGISERLQSTAIELPYANPDYSMIIILPHMSKGLDSLINTIKAQDLYDLVNDMYDDEVKVVIPKFKAEERFELAGPLYSMGIKSLFDPRFADLSSFFRNTSDISEGIALNSVVHMASITVNEEGTEAAAATAIIYGRSGRPVFPTQFNANRPFLYLVWDKATHFILFMGTVRRPE